MNEGWICPKCGAGVSPLEKTCPCVSHYVSVPNPLTPQPWQPMTPYNPYPFPYTPPSTPWSPPWQTICSGLTNKESAAYINV